MSVKTLAILAAGVGSRLRPITTDIPKCMVKVGGRPILGHQLDVFHKAGITDVKIVLGYEAQKVVDYCMDWRGMAVEFFVNEDYENNNNMYSMYLMRDALKGRDFIFCNGDVIYDEWVAAQIVNSPDEDYIAVDQGTHDQESMKVILDVDGYIAGIRKSFSSEEAYGRSVDLYRLTPGGSTAFFDEIARIIEGEGSVREWTEVALDRLCRKGGILFKPFNVHPHPWVEVDNYADLVRADRVFSGLELDGCKAFFVDIDGTLAIGERAIQGAPDFVQRLRDGRKAVYFISNNSSRSKADYVVKLRKLGIKAGEDEIILSTDGLAELLQSISIKRVYCLGTESMKAQLLLSGIEHVEDQPEAVVVGYDTELTYEKLRKACAWINAGKEYYVTHMDVFCPSPDGPVPDAGTLIRTIELTTGRRPKAVLGKPNSAMLSHVIGRLYKPEETVLVGDRIYTDKAMADRMGIRFICVLSGETRREDLQVFDENEWPSLIVDSVASIS